MAQKFSLKLQKKPLDLQKITWSDHKHHDTAKLLVCVAPNSSIIFTSKAYAKSPSYKKLTNRSENLDLVPMCSRITLTRVLN